MAPKKAKVPDEGGKSDKPLPLRTDKVEKMRNPTARMGPSQDSQRNGQAAAKETKKGQTSNRGGGKGGKSVESPPSHGGAKKPDKPEAAAPPKKPLGKVPETGPTGGAGSSASGASGGAAPGAAPKPDAAATKATLAGPASKKKVDFLTEEMMSRKPLDEKAREALIKKCGPSKQEVHFERNESHRPIGRPDELSPSRHERVPPSCIVLMFNCFESSFDLVFGDITTLPESDTTDLRSLTSGKILGRVKITPEKGTPFEDRVEFINEWKFASEHGLVHDGLQSDGSIELRMDWKVASARGGFEGDFINKVAILSVNPWLAYGCGQGARLAIRKPGATESTASTLQRTLRDDYVVVRRDGSDSELTVDPTPFTVVLAKNTRHKPGTRLLIVQEGSCVDAVVETWPETEIDIKEGSRHLLKVEGKHISGWLTFAMRDGTDNFEPMEQPEEGEEEMPPTIEGSNDEEDGGDPRPHILTRKKQLAMHSGCDPTNSEKIGMITNKMPIRILEKRETEEFGMRAYISTIPSQSNLMSTIALNEFNHSVQRFPSVAEYEAARANYLEDIVVREANVEDAITGNNLRIKDQTLHISTATDANENGRPIPDSWKVTNVLDLVTLLLIPSPNRVSGSHSTQPVLVRAGPGTGKTWMAKQAVFTLADRLLRGTGSNDGIRLVPIVVFVQRIIYLLRETSAKDGKETTLLERYIESVYSGKKYESWCTMLMQAYEMRALVVLLDGVDEAAGLRDQIEAFVHKEVVPSGNRVLVTSRPEGVQLSTYAKTFVVMNLCALSNEQQRRVINIQMQGNIFFDHLLSLGEVRKMLDDAYRKVAPNARSDLETMWCASGWLLEGTTEYNPEERQKDLTGTRFVDVRPTILSEYLTALDAEIRSSNNEMGLSLLERVDAICKEMKLDEMEDESCSYEQRVLEGFASLVTDGEGRLTKEHDGGDACSVALKLGQLYHKEKLLQAEEASIKEKQKPPPVPQYAIAGRAKLEALLEGKGSMDRLWTTVCARTEELYLVHEDRAQLLDEMLAKLVIECAREDAEADQMVNDIEHVGYLDPISIYEAAYEYKNRFVDGGLPEACVTDVVRVRLSLQTGAQIKEIVQRLHAGVSISAEQAERGPVKASQRNEIAEQEAQEQAVPGYVPPPAVTEMKLMSLTNKFEDLDPTHFRHATAFIKIIHRPKPDVEVAICAAVELHFFEILRVATSTTPVEHYAFFRKRLKGSVPENELDLLLEEKLVFLVDATGVPVLLSLLVLIFTAGGEDLTKLPSNRIELYELGIESAIAKRLLPGGKTSSDQLVHEWLRLFNLDRSAMSAAITADGTEKKEREHRPTRKASLSQELSQGVNEAKMKAESEAASKKKADAGSQNKGDKKLFNLDQKEVYEVFRHGAHYLREANKPEVQRTELNRIELLMPKKLVDTVMMLVNANLKMLLGGKSEAFGLNMLRHVAVSNQLAGRREFSAVHVAKALLIDQLNTEGFTLWLHLNKEEGGLPLTKTLEAQTELAPAQYQFKHLSFQEGLFAQDLLIKADLGWETWETDETAAEFLNNPFMNNTCRIAAGDLGTRLSKKRPTWDFSAQGTRLTEVGLQALWLICEKNEKLKVLNLKNNSVGTKIEDAPGLAKMLQTSTGLVDLKLGSNNLGDLKAHLRGLGRGLSTNKTLTKLDVSNNHLLPDGIKIICNALRSCTAMQYLDLSYNSPGREAALSGMLLVHPNIRSIGVIEKEPTTRSERTWWLDTRAKEAIGRALLDSTAKTVQFLQCDVFSLREDTETITWISRAPCDAIVLAGVLRANTTLKTLNIAQGDIGDYEREEIGRALLSNSSGRVGFCDQYGLKENMGSSFTVDLKDKDQIRSKRSFTLFAGLLRANSALTSLTISSVSPEHIEVLADGLATNTTMQELRLEQPNKMADTAIATLPVQQLNGALKVDTIDLTEAGIQLPDGTYQPCHRYACGVVGAVLGASENQTIRCLKINPGGGSEGGAILDHLHRARRSSLVVLDVTGIGLGDRGGSKFFESLLAGKCTFLKSLHMGSNELTDLAVGPLIVEVLRQDTCHIETLDINNNQISAPVITQAVKYNKSLTSLNIVGTGIEDEGMGAIGKLLLEPDCSCQMRYIMTEEFMVKEGSSDLEIKSAELSSGAAQLLAGVFKYNNLIKSLNLSGRGIEMAAASVLAVAVQHNTTLKSIDLSNNPLSTVSQYTGKDAYPMTGITALADAVKASSSLDAITLEGGKLPVDQIKGDKKVRMLDLSRKSLSYISSIFIGVLLRGNSNVNELILHSNDLTPVGATFIVKQLMPSLKTLDIANIVEVEDKKADKGGKGRPAGVQRTQLEIVPEQLEELWAAATTLGSIEKLTIDRDHLRDLKDIGKLLSLKTLSLSKNKLTTIPDDISFIRGLRTLTLQGNQLKEVPSSIGDLENLEKLDLRSNQLVYLPSSISSLRQLKQLDASENQLLTLDPSICDLHVCERVELKDNPLQRPPAAIARQGIGQIRKFFQEIVMTNDVQAHGARMVMLGHVSSGKTVLQRAIRLGSAQPSNVIEGTTLMDVQMCALGADTKQVMMSIWDLSGNPSYASCQQPYIADGSLYLLCVPATVSVEALEASYELYIGRFLKMLQLGAPNAVVLPVLTLADKLLPGKERSDPQVEAAAEAHLEWLNERLEAFQNSQPDNIGVKLRVQLPANLAVSAITGGENVVETLKGRLLSIANSEARLLPTVNMSISKAMSLTLVFLRAVRDGRDPADSARAADLGYIPSTMSTDLKTPCPYIDHAELRSLYLTDFVPALKLQSSDADRVLADAISLCSNDGSLSTMGRGLVYLHPAYLLRLMKPLCDERMGNRLWQGRTLSMADAVRATSTGGHGLPEAERNTVIIAAEEFGKTGMLREELFPIMWEPIGLRRDDYASIAIVLSAAGLCFLASNTHLGRMWCFPHRLPHSPPADYKLGWTDALRHPGTEVLSISIALGAAAKSGVLERVYSSIQGLGNFRSIWRGSGTSVAPGALLEARPDALNFHWLLLELRTREGKGDVLPTFELALECVGHKADRTDAYSSLLLIKARAQTVIDEVVTLKNRTKASFCCPGCIAAKDGTASAWALEELSARFIKCEKCGEGIALQQSSAPTAVALGPHATSYDSTLLFEEPEAAHSTELRFCSEKMRYGLPLEGSYSLGRMLGIDADDVDRIRLSTDHAIAEECMSQLADEINSLQSDEHGWTDLDWLRYVSGTNLPTPPKASEMAARRGSMQMEAPKPRAETDDEAAKSMAALHAELHQTAQRRGNDKGIEEPNLDYFVHLPMAEKAGLSRAHVLALRLYSTFGYASRINAPLHAGCDERRPHPLPSLVVHLVDAFWRLRVAQAENRKSLALKVEQCDEAARAAKMTDDDELIENTSKAAAAADKAKAAHRLEEVFCGVGSMYLQEFKQRGSMEVGFFSVAQDKHVAQADALKWANVEMRAMRKLNAKLALMRPREVPELEDAGRRMSKEEISKKEVEPKEEEIVHVPLRVVPKGALAATAAAGGVLMAECVEVPDESDRVEEEATHHGGAREVPLRLLKILTSSENFMPVSLSDFSVMSDVREWIYPPGTAIEHRKETLETLGTGEDGEDVHCKGAEVQPRLTKPSWVKVSKGQTN